jgi:5-methylcytosine-specific restriction endonuclease McrA
MSFSEETVQAVWNKGTAVPGNDGSLWRKDQCGAWIGRDYYANRASEYGWEIDHIRPRSQGGTDHLSNLRPLQWKNNVNKQSGRLGCAVTGRNGHNVAAG